MSIYRLGWSVLFVLAAGGWRAALGILLLLAVGAIQLREKW
jgi:hypothetical protein